MPEVCIYCGRQIHGVFAIVKIIPLFAVKWALTGNDIPEVLTTNINKGVSHHSCKKRNIVSMPNLDDLYIEDHVYKALKPIEIKYRFDAYDNMEIIKKIQDYKCEVCNKPLGKDCNLRRIDNSKPRSLINAVCIHTACNRRFNATERK